MPFLAQLLTIKQPQPTCVEQGSAILGGWGSRHHVSAGILFECQHQHAVLRAFIEGPECGECGSRGAYFTHILDVMDGYTMVNELHSKTTFVVLLTTQSTFTLGYIGFTSRTLWYLAWETGIKPQTIELTDDGPCIRFPLLSWSRKPFKWNRFEWVVLAHIKLTSLWVLINMYVDRNNLCAQCSISCHPSCSHSSGDLGSHVRLMFLDFSSILLQTFVNKLQLLEQRAYMCNFVLDFWMDRLDC